MVNDRGNIKWVSLMLPEHVKMLKEMWRETEKIQRPKIDSQQYQEFDELVCEAMGFHWPLQFDYFHNGRILKVSGYVHYYDETKGKFYIESLQGKRCTLNLQDVTGVQQLE